MSEPGAVRQSEFFPKNGIKPAESKKIRDKFLQDDDWYVEGRTIWIRPSGIQRLVIAEEEPKLAQKFVELFVVRQAPNHRYVLCSLTQGKGVLVPCLIPRRMRGDRMLGKPIRAEEMGGDGQPTIYRHEDCARY